jgi:hypothetical protein
MEHLPKSLQKTNRGIFKNDNFDWIIELLQHEIFIPITYKPDVPSFSKATCLLAIEWKTVEQIIRNTREEQLFFKDLVSIPRGANTNTYTIMRCRYPKIKNIKRLKNAVENMGDAFSNFLFEKERQIGNIKESMYNKLPFRSTKDILRALPSIPNKYNGGMTMIIMDPTSPDHKEVVIDEEMANLLNENEQDVLKYII